MRSFLILQRAKNIKRHDDGTPWSWQSLDEIAQFKSIDSFIKYVENHIKELGADVVCVSGSGSLITSTNQFLAEQQRKAGVL